MGHYPIKCIHCMRRVRMKDRLVRLDSRSLKAEENSRTSTFGSIDLDLTDSFDIDGSISLEDDLGAPVFRSIQSLEEEGKIEECTFFPVTISKEIEELERKYGWTECVENDLIQAITVKDIEIKGRHFSGKINEFYCNYCNKKLIPQAGQLPIFLVCMMGPSSAGKTVYLTMLHHLTAGKTYRLPAGYIHFETIGEPAREYRNYANDMLYKCQLPPTTANATKDAYLLKAEYVIQPNSGIVNKKCIIGFVDMRGEMFSGDKNEDLKEKNLPQFKHADGFIMLVDPVTLEGVYNRLNAALIGNRDHAELTQVIDNLKLVIGDHIIPEFPGGRINRPSVIALSKIDLLQKHNQVLGIPLTQPVIAPNFYMKPELDMFKYYFNPMNISTMQCIDYLSPGFKHFMDSIFEKPRYVSVSALGANVEIHGDKINFPGALTGIRVQDPLLLLLMEFNIIPPFYRSDYSENPGRIMSIWGGYYAELWDAGPVYNEQAEVPEKKEKKGWFGRKK